MKLFDVEESKAGREMTDYGSLPVVQLMPKAQSAGGLTSLQSALGNATVTAAMSGGIFALQTKPRTPQSGHGNTAIAESQVGGSAETTAEVEETSPSETSSAEITGAAIPSDPRTFVFKTVRPNTTPGEPGGWQETDIVTLRFHHLGKNAKWSCSLIVGVPLRNYRGEVDPDIASLATGLAADAANQVTFEMMDCNAFKRLMAKLLNVAIPGATVNSPK